MAPDFAVAPVPEDEVNLVLDHSPEVNENVRDQAVQVNRFHMIPLAGYRRAPYNTHSCIIAGCNNRNLQRINIDIRALVLQEKCFYIPRGSRVCEEHSLNIVWQDIEMHTRIELNEFSGAHIKETMDILRTRKFF